MNPQKYLKPLRRRVVTTWLPDTCQIETVGGITMGEDGTLTRTNVLRTYQGSPNIPCRIESSRSFRPDSFPNQELGINEHILHLPVDVPLKTNDKVRINGRVFEVRKHAVATTFRLTNEALIQEAEGQHD